MAELMIIIFQSKKVSKMRPKWNFPLDPDCPRVKQFAKARDDPIMKMSGCWDEFLEDFSNQHRIECKRCQEYGATNTEVV